MFVSVQMRPYLQQMHYRSVCVFVCGGGLNGGDCATTALRNFSLSVWKMISLSDRQARRQAISSGSSSHTPSSEDKSRVGTLMAEDMHRCFFSWYTALLSQVYVVDYKKDCTFSHNCSHAPELQVSDASHRDRRS